MSEYVSVVRSLGMLVVSFIDNSVNQVGIVDDSAYASAAAYVAALNAIIPSWAVSRDNTSSLGNTLYMAKLDGSRIRVNIVNES